MTLEREVTGTDEQEALFDELWRDYWQAQAAPLTVSSHAKGRRWRDGMALFASTRAQYEVALQKAQIDIWRNPKK